MKKTIVFKTLVDILYLFHFIGLAAIVFIIPFGIVAINQVNIAIEDWSLFYWLIFIVSLVTYLIFLRGLYFLRKMARFLLSHKYFSVRIIQSLKKSGIHFLLTGVLNFSLFVAVWINKLNGGEIELIFGNNNLIPLFLMIIGMFFIIQSNTLELARGFKEENQLTI